MPKLHLLQAEAFCCEPASKASAAAAATIVRFIARSSLFSGPAFRLSR
jgi:hypothetical protein